MKTNNIGADMPMLLYVSIIIYSLQLLANGNCILMENIYSTLKFKHNSKVTFTQVSH